jgi:hypothetical protein
MSKTETGKIENAKTARVLRDDELDVVSGGFHWGVSNTSWEHYRPADLVASGATR